MGRGGYAVCMTYAELSAITAALQQRIPDPGAFAFVNTRLVLRTGVNLNAIRPEDNGDKVRVQRVLTALRDMGFALDS